MQRHVLVSERDARRVLRDDVDKRALMRVKRRRTGQLAQIAALQHGGKLDQRIAKRRADVAVVGTVVFVRGTRGQARRRRNGDGSRQRERRSEQQRIGETGGGEPARVTQRARGLAQRTRDVALLVERGQRLRERREGERHAAAARVGQRVERGDRR